MWQSGRQKSGSADPAAACVSAGADRQRGNHGCGFSGQQCGNGAGDPLCAGLHYEGDYKKQCLFYNQVLVGTDKNTNQLTAYGIHKFNQFLKSLDSGLTIEFKDFKQYEDLLLDIAEEVEKLTYLIEYSKVNDFATYKVKEIYED